jgi:hypothetical protein
MGMQLGCHEMGQPFADPCARSLKLAGWLLLLVAQPRVTAPLWLVTIALSVFCTGRLGDDARKLGEKGVGQRALAAIGVSGVDPRLSTAAAASSMVFIVLLLPVAPPARLLVENR